jgi:tetratricopeptide (TPR) repeat protein
MTPAQRLPGGGRRDLRFLGLVVTVLAVLVGGLVLRPSESTAPAGDADALKARFEAAVALLKARRFDAAVAAWNALAHASPQLPEAHVNLGYALLGAGRADDARRAFDHATTLRPDQANAYYGLALAHEAGGDLALATGAMRSYLHLARNEDPRHLARARAALWEWEQARAR